MNSLRRKVVNHMNIYKPDIDDMIFADEEVRVSER